MCKQIYNKCVPHRALFKIEAINHSNQHLKLHDRSHSRYLFCKYRKWFIKALTQIFFNHWLVFDHMAAKLCLLKSLGLLAKECARLYHTFHHLLHFVINANSTSTAFGNVNISEPQSFITLQELWDQATTTKARRFRGGDRLSQQKNSEKQPNIVIVHMNIYNYSWAISHFHPIFLHHYCNHLKWIRERN